jgi:tetratricopeptide (TPR) repeat protein
MLTDVQWAQLQTEDPALIERVRRDLEDLARGRCGWAEVLRIGDKELLGIAKVAAAKLKQGRAAEAERIFWALTELDPFVSWFWMALGDARGRQGQIQEAIDCYDRCIHEASQMQPPAEDQIRRASLRRGKLQVRARDVNPAVADFTKVLELDNDETLSGKQAWLAVQALVDSGSLPKEVLDSLHEHWRNHP